MVVFQIILALVGLGFMAWLIAGQVTPHVRRERCFDAPAAAWVDLWLPLISALPLGLAAALTYPPPGHWWYSVWYAATPAAIVVSLLLGLILILVRHDRLRGSTAFELRHGLALVLIGAVLALASLADRLSILHGQMMLVAAVVWMWLSSPTHDAMTENTSSVRGRLIVDWSGKLRHPVSWTTKALLGAALLGWAGLASELFRFDLPSAVLAATVFQLFIGVDIVRSLGRGPAQRYLISSLVFSVLLGVGGMAASKLYTNVYLPWFPETYERFGPSVLIGVSSIRATGIFLIGLGVVVFMIGAPLGVDADAASNGSSSPGGRKAKAGIAHPRYPITGILLLVAAVILAITGSESALRDAGLLVARLIWHGFGGPPSTP